jgi:hypothetical protein
VTWRAWRLTFAMHGLVVWLLAGASVLLLIGSVLLAWQTNETRAAFLACMQRAGEGSDSCRGFDLNGLNQWAITFKLGAQWMPLVLGLFLGVPVVAREIEGQTAPIAWALDPSRRRWLVQRAAPVLVVAAVAGVLIGIGGEALSKADAFGEHSFGAGFTDYGSRLGQVPVRAVAVFVVGVGIGTVVPRQLPALLLAGGMVIVLFVLLLTLGMSAWMQASAEPIAYDRGLEAGSRLFDQAFQDNKTGALIGTGTFDATPPPENVPPPEENAPPGMTRVWLGIPGDQYGLWVARESAVVLGGALLLAVGTFVLVQRRRPS